MYQVFELFHNYNMGNQHKKTVNLNYLIKCENYNAMMQFKNEEKINEFC